jgi:arsenite methyltransferase
MGSISLLAALWRTGWVNEEAWLHSIPEPTVASFAGTGNPFSVGRLLRGERIVDVGCGGGIDSLVAAKMVGPEGTVIGVDMTPQCWQKREQVRLPQAQRT